MKKLLGKNVRGWLALALPALIPVAAHAEPLVLSAPDAQAPAATAQPTVQVPQPAQNAPAPQAVTGRVLVLPFLPVNPNETSPWLGKSIQESLVADLMVVAPDRVLRADQPAATAEAAVALGRQNNAQFVVTGGYVSIDHEVRITGQVLDAVSGKALTGLKVTGDPTQIFHLEDTLAMQVKNELMPGQQPQQAQIQMQPVQQAPQQQQPVVQAPQTTTYYSTYANAPTPPVYGADTSAYTYYYPNYGYDYSPYSYAYPYYGYYGYGYPYLGIGLGYGYRGGYYHGGFRSGAFVHGGGGFHGGGGGGFHGGGGHGGGHR